MLTPLKQRFRLWLFRNRMESGAIILTQRRIFILPTRQGWSLAFLLLLMLLGDLNYNLSLGYVLTFLLAMMAVMSMLHAFRNLVRLEIRAGQAEPVFCGKTAHFVLHFQSSLPRYQLHLSDGKGNQNCFDLQAGLDNKIAFPVAATRRGWLEAGQLTLYTLFPLGLFHAWSYLHFDMRCLVYPEPMAEASLPQEYAPEGSGKRQQLGDEDFYGLRAYVPGDAMPRIAWKALAREQGLQVKQFSTQLGDELWLDLTLTPDLDLEGKLARLTRWVLDAEQQGLRYGLRLSGKELPPGNGTAQRNECLRRIALYDLT